MECKIVSPETTKLFWGQKWRERDKYLAENQTNLSYNTFCTSVCYDHLPFPILFILTTEKIVLQKFSSD